MCSVVAFCIVGSSAGVSIGVLPSLTLTLIPSFLLPGFAAMDATVMVMTELTWAFILQDHALLKTGFKYTLRFLLAPVSLDRTGFPGF